MTDDVDSFLLPCSSFFPMNLTAALQQQICAYIRAGGYPHVAAAAAGVPEAVFAEWLRQGREVSAGEPYRGFALAVDEAAAQARLAAETNVFRDNPGNWLKLGPGKETPDGPGWTTTARPCRQAADEAREPLANPAVREMIFTLLRELGAFPDARAAAARVLEDRERNKR